MENAAESMPPFPFEPYPCQVSMMRAMERGLRAHRDCVIESPTGTGKTLSLLATALHYALPLKKRIVYVSRTHSQLTQAVRELESKLLSFYPKLRYSVLGSRDQLCTHPRVSKSKGDKQEACLEACKSKECGRRWRLVDVNGDIEDLFKKAKKEGACGFFSSREKAKRADLVFAPYQYVLMDLTTEKFDIVIFDEAHNVPDQAEAVMEIADGKYCFDPSLAVERLRPATLVFASGTLAPLDPFARDLGLVNPVCLENDHVVPNSNVLAVTIANEGLVRTFANKDCSDYVDQLVSLIRRAEKAMPAGGMLVFFPNYSSMDAVNSRLRVLCEPRKGDQLPKVLARFFSARKAILLAVYRGKIAEGIDFPDDKCRCVIATGIPYAPLLDPRLVAKREAVLGDWYESDAMRAVNQAVGRALRHKDDYAAVIFADYRFIKKLPLLSKWARTNATQAEDEDQIFAMMRAFFSKRSVVDEKKAASTAVIETPFAATTSAAAPVSEEEDEVEPSEKNNVEDLKSFFATTVARTRNVEKPRAITIAEAMSSACVVAPPPQSLLLSSKNKAVDPIKPYGARERRRKRPETTTITLKENLLQKKGETGGGHHIAWPTDFGRRNEAKPPSALPRPPQVQRRPTLPVPSKPIGKAVSKRARLLLNLP